MNKAAYERGNRLISLHACKDSGCPGCTACSPHVPTPRPPGWGDKALERAVRIGECVISGAAKYGRPPPTTETLAEIIRERARVGEKTAREATRRCLPRA